MKTEFVCERCGINVICCIPVPDETLYCVECRFIEGIEDPVAREETARFLDSRKPADLSDD
jgi:hypothetical protein